MRAHQVDGLIVATSGGYEDIGRAGGVLRHVPSGDQRLRGGDGQRGRRRAARRAPRASSTATSGSASSAASSSVGRERLDGFRARAGRAGAAAGARAHPARGPARRGGRRARRHARAAGPARSRRRPSWRARTRSRAGDAARAARRRAAGCRRTSRWPRSTSWCWPTCSTRPVTSLDRHDAELGRRSAELLLGALRTGARAVPDVHRVAMALRPRRSCGCDGQAS